MSIHTSTDKIAISLSLLCAIHCLGLPLMLILLPSLTGTIIADEAFHLWLVLAVIPISAYSLSMGCKQHQRYPIIIYGILGILFLIAAVISEDYLGEQWEIILTLIGTSIIALSHYKNYRICNYYKRCTHTKPKWMS